MRSPVESSVTMPTRLQRSASQKSPPLPYLPIPSMSNFFSSPCAQRTSAGVRPTASGKETHRPLSTLFVNNIIARMCVHAHVCGDVWVWVCVCVSVVCVGVAVLHV